MSKPIPEELLSAYLDGELSPSEMESVREQLTIAENADKLASLRKNQDRLRKLPSYQLGDDFAERVMAAIEFDDPGDDSISTLAPSTNQIENTPWRLALVAITALAAMVILALFVRPAPENNRILGSESARPVIEEMHSKAKGDELVDGKSSAGRESSEKSDKGSGGILVQEKKSRNDNSGAEGKLPVALQPDDMFDKKKISGGDSNSSTPPSNKAIKKALADQVDSIKKGMAGKDKKESVFNENSPKNPASQKGAPKVSPAQQIDNERKGPPAQTLTQFQTLQKYQQTYANNDLEEIVHVKVGQRDFDNYTVEKALLSNQIDCKIPAERDRKNRKPLANSATKKLESKNVYRTKMNNIRFLMVEAPDHRLISSFKQLKNIKIDPLVLAQTDKTQTQIQQSFGGGGFRGGGGGAGSAPMGGGGLKRNMPRGNSKTKSGNVKQLQQSNEKFSYNNWAQQNRARNYVHPAELPEAELNRRSRIQRGIQKEYQDNQQKILGNSNPQRKAGGKSQQDQRSESGMNRTEQFENEKQNKTESQKSDIDKGDPENQDPLASPELRRISEHFSLLPQPAYRRMLLVIQSDPEIDEEIARSAQPKIKPAPAESKRSKK